MSKDNVQPRHLEAARLYLVGPTGVRANWRRACEVAGFNRVPSLESKVVLAALAKERANTEIIPDPDMVMLENLLSGDPTWEEIAVYARRVMVKIGTGLIKANSGQVTALKETIARAEGRIGQEKDLTEEEVLGVVILPVILGKDELRMIDIEVGDEV